MNLDICPQNSFSLQLSIASTIPNVGGVVENKHSHAPLVDGYPGVVILGSNLAALGEIKYTMC